MKFLSDLFQKIFSSQIPDNEEVSLGVSPEDVVVLGAIDPNVVIGKILTIRPHKDPSITKVRVTTCDLGNGKSVQILCGGINIAEEQIVPIAKIGTVLPGNFQISVRDIRGEASHGMICAKSELGISAEDEPKGAIWELPKSLELKIGISICKLALPPL